MKTPRSERERLLAGEVGAVRKEWGGRLRVALVYPNRYAAAMSNLGFLSIHARINARPDALCERSVLPGRGGAGYTAGTTLESGRRLRDFDVVAFSLSYENDLFNLASLLSAGGVEPLRDARDAAGGRRPLVLAGGFAASLNPEVSGAFADAVVVGDGERAMEAILDNGAPSPGDEAYLRALARVPGTYVPRGYAMEYAPPTGGGVPRLRAIVHRPGFPPRVRRETVDLATLPPLLPVLSKEAELGELSLVETSRGCPKMCGFCAAAHACPGFRETSLARALEEAELARPHRRRIGLVGAAVLDWRGFKAFSREILARGGTVSPASVRADLVDEEVAEILKESGHRTVALAPECGGEALRAALGKRVPDDVFRAAASRLVRAGIVSFKLYFLSGLPGGREDGEIEETAAFLSRFREWVLAEARGIGRMGTVTAVVSGFVPKPFTPLQWAPMVSEESLRRRLEGIAARVRGLANVRVTGDVPRDAILQGFLSLGDRRAGRAAAAGTQGKKNLLRRGCDPLVADTVFREREAGECLPWDVVEGGLRKSALRARYASIVEDLARRG